MKHQDFYLVGGGKEEWILNWLFKILIFALVFSGIYTVQHQNVENNIRIQKKQKHFMIM